MNAYKVNTCENTTLIEENIISIHVLLPSPRHFPLHKNYRLGIPKSTL